MFTRALIAALVALVLLCEAAVAAPTHDEQARVTQAVHTSLWPETAADDYRPPNRGGWVDALVVLVVAAAIGGAMARKYADARRKNEGELK